MNLNLQNKFSGNEIQMNRIGQDSGSDPDDEVDFSRPRLKELRKWKDPKIQFRFKMAIIISECFIISTFMGMLDILVAFDYLPASLGTVTLKFAIIFPIWIYAAKRFFTLMNFTKHFIYSLKIWLIPFGFALFIYAYTSVTFFAGF